MRLGAVLPPAFLWAQAAQLPCRLGARAHQKRDVHLRREEPSAVLDEAGETGRIAVPADARELADSVDASDQSQHFVNLRQP
jgi:hypothetical protein